MLQRECAAVSEHQAHQQGSRGHAPTAVWSKGHTTQRGDVVRHPFFQITTVCIFFCSRCVHFFFGAISVHQCVHTTPANNNTMVSALDRSVHALDRGSCCSNMLQFAILLCRVCAVSAALTPPPFLLICVTTARVVSKTCVRLEMRHDKHCLLSSRLSRRLALSLSLLDASHLVVAVNGMPPSSGVLSLLNAPSHVVLLLSSEAWPWAKCNTR